MPKVCIGESGLGEHHYGTLVEGGRARGQGQRGHVEITLPRRRRQPCTFPTRGFLRAEEQSKYEGEPRWLRAKALEEACSSHVRQLGESSRTRSSASGMAGHVARVRASASAARKIGTQAAVAGLG